MREPIDSEEFLQRKLPLPCGWSFQIGAGCLRFNDPDRGYFGAAGTTNVFNAIALRKNYDVSYSGSGKPKIKAGSLGDS